MSVLPRLAPEGIVLSEAPATPGKMNVSEHRLFGLLKSLGLRVVPQARIGPFTVDFLLPDLDVVVESDGRPYHGARDDAAHDRWRDRQLQERGLVVIHTWTEDLLAPEGHNKILRHVRLRILRARGVRLGGPGAQSQFSRYASRAIATSRVSFQDRTRRPPRSQ